jgi:hypothetical protein
MSYAVRSPFDRLLRSASARLKRIIHNGTDQNYYLELFSGWFAER